MSCPSSAFRPYALADRWEEKSTCSAGNVSCVRRRAGILRYVVLGSALSILFRGTTKGIPTWRCARVGHVATPVRSISAVKFDHNIEVVFGPNRSVRRGGIRGSILCGESAIASRTSSCLKVLRRCIHYHQLEELENRAYTFHALERARVRALLLRI